MDSSPVKGEYSYLQMCISLKFPGSFHSLFITKTYMVCPLNV